MKTVNKNILKSYILSLKSRHGFTLIELIVVITIIAVLFTALAAIFNPFAQIQKAKNVTRQHDINEIKNALDTYFNDTGCYPTSIPFGGRFSSGKTVYIEKLPEDPDCASSNLSNCYDYETDGSSCPQWNILYAQMQKPIVSGIATCILSSASDCLPSGGMLSYNYCQVSGKLNCAYIKQNQLPTPVVPAGAGNNGNGGNGGGNNPPTPTPTIDCGGNLSACSNGICNVKNGQAFTCQGCGGVAHCYSDLQCGGVDCTKQP